jgi:hypothetical protein
MEIRKVAIGQKTLRCEQGTGGDELVFIPAQASAHGDSKE